MIPFSKKLNILIVEDSPSDAFLITEFLNEVSAINYEYQHSETIKEAIEKLEEEDFDAVLIDYNLPDSNGATHLEYIFKQYNHIPFIVLTGLADEAVSINALKRGAKDYLIKGDFDAKILNRSILYALERKRLEEETVIRILAAQDTEKERIARDVHDTLGQNLTSASLQMQSIKSLIPVDNNELHESIDTALRCINDSIAESRGISRSLMPQTVKKFGLESGIESIIMTLNDQSKIQFELESNLEFTRFDRQKELALFRIAQEAINNILKYSKADNVEIKLILVDDLLLLQIDDNGVGFDPDDINNQKGIGLESIRMRAKSIGAKLELNSKIGKGTNIRVVTEIYNKTD
ncbi:MAG: response regulator [Vicingaceae bacterium]